ncbi:MAG: hypothetical protein P4M14_04900 [Gammaproteobacteria bacterium]|nr:hypothetical protein [Gammaproteobacteria bacterium]
MNELHKQVIRDLIDDRLYRHEKRTIYLLESGSNWTLAISFIILLIDNKHMLSGIDNMEILAFSFVIISTVCRLVVSTKVKELIKKAMRS